MSSTPMDPSKYYCTKVQVYSAGYDCLSHASGSSYGSCQQGSYIIANPGCIYEWMGLWNRDAIITPNTPQVPYNEYTCNSEC